VLWKGGAVWLAVGEQKKEAGQTPYTIHCTDLGLVHTVIHTVVWLRNERWPTEGLNVWQLSN